MMSKPLGFEPILWGNQKNYVLLIIVCGIYTSLFWQIHLIL